VWFQCASARKEELGTTMCKMTDTAIHFIAKGNEIDKALVAL